MTYYIAIGLTVLVPVICGVLVARFGPLLDD